MEERRRRGAASAFVGGVEARGRLALGAAPTLWLGGPPLGGGGCKILTVRPSPAEGIDFEYVIHNADGAEVEQCGNGARCFARFVRDQGLTDKDVIRVQTMKGCLLYTSDAADERTTVDLGGRRIIEKKKKH